MPDRQSLLGGETPILMYAGARAASRSVTCLLGILAELLGGRGVFSLATARLRRRAVKDVFQAMEKKPSGEIAAARCMPKACVTRSIIIIGRV